LTTVKHADLFNVLLGGCKSWANCNDCCGLFMTFYCILLSNSWWMSLCS